MMDIVERLRQLFDRDDVYSCNEAVDAMQEAAAEIERLRAALRAEQDATEKVHAADAAEIERLRTILAQEK